MEDISEELRSLKYAVEELHTTTKRANSTKAVFVRGIIGGVGTFLGATIVAALLIAIITQILILLDFDIGISNYLQSLIQKRQ